MAATGGAGIWSVAGEQPQEAGAQDAARADVPQRRGPIFLSVEPGSGMLLVLCEKSGTIARVDPHSGVVAAEERVGEAPFAMTAYPPGEPCERLYVTCRRGQEVVELDAGSLATLRRFPLRGDPTGVAVSADGRRLYAGVHSLDQVAVFDLEKGTEIKRLGAGNGPQMVRLNPQAGRVYVTNLLPNPGPPDQPCRNEITVIDDRTLEVVERVILLNANVGRHIDFTPDGARAVAVISRPKNLIPETQVARGWVVTNGFAVLSPGTDVPPIQLLVDLPNQAYADPYGVAFAPDGRRFYLTSAGMDTVLAVDLDQVDAVIAEAAASKIPRYSDHLGLSRRYVTARIAVGANPQGLAVSRDGRWLYVANRLDDSISVIDTTRDRLVRTLLMGRPSPELPDETFAHGKARTFPGQLQCIRCHEGGVPPDRLLRGERFFHSAARTFQGQFSCSSCHPDGGFDGLQYDLEPDGMGQNIVDNRNLRGIAGTGPYKWTAKNAEIEEQCGQRTAKWIVRTGWLPSAHVSELADYIRSIPATVNPYRLPDGRLTAAQERGKAIFERMQTNDGKTIVELDRCDWCHTEPPWYYREETFDIGSRQAQDSTEPWVPEAMAGPTRVRSDLTSAFDTAHLLNVFESPPYLHHGKAATLEEIWTKYDPEGRHGVTKDLTPEQMSDLIEFLKAL